MDLNLVRVFRFISWALGFRKTNQNKNPRLMIITAIFALLDGNFTAVMFHPKVILFWMFEIFAVGITYVILGIKRSGWIWRKTLLIIGVVELGMIVAAPLYT